MILNTFLYKINVYKILIIIIKKLRNELAIYVYIGVLFQVFYKQTYIPEIYTGNVYFNVVHQHLEFLVFNEYI